MEKLESPISKTPSIGASIAQNLPPMSPRTVSRIINPIAYVANIAAIAQEAAPTGAPTPSPTAASVVATSDFESGAAADGWITSTFSMVTGSTTSSATGPPYASSGSYYMYAETSSPNYPYGVFEMYQEFDGAVTTVDFDYPM